MEERALIFRLLKARFSLLDDGAFSQLCRGKQVSKRGWEPFAVSSIADPP